jgi:heme/copper-type cytochrome/quinol oxidase subunit 3
MVLATIWFSQMKEKFKWTFLGAMILGSIFVIVQGQEWIRLISSGMTLVSGVFGACFFLLIGMHGLHAVSAIAMMIYLWSKMKKGVLQNDHMQAMSIYWLFIVSIWPVLYILVYF